MGFVGRGLINKMNICILNSGFGSRLKKYTAEMPKRLVPLNDNYSILSKQIDIFGSLGGFNYVVTTGYLDGMIQEYLKNRYLIGNNLNLSN
jgi:NDP-sugar pyrophosphorylase family protein